MSDSYVYIIFRQNGYPCYVGKGRGARWKRHDRHKENPHLRAILAQASGKLPVVKIKEGLTNYDAAALEILFIAAIGRERHGGPLVNLTDGGEGTVGAIMSDEWKANRSKKAKELWNNPNHRLAMSELRRGNQYKKGKPNSELWRTLTSERMAGNTHTLGLKHTDSAKRKMSEARKGKPKSPEHRAKLAENCRKLAMLRAQGAFPRRAAG